MEKFLSNFKPKRKPSPEKDVNPKECKSKKTEAKTVRKYIPEWKMGRKWLMHDENKECGVLYVLNI